MLIDLETNQGEWFTFRMSKIDRATGETIWNDPVEGVRVRIRSFKPFFEELVMKQEQIVEWKVNPKTRQNERHVYSKDLTPEEKMRERDDAIDFAITGLEGWVDKKTHKPIECTRENKLALMDKGFFDRFFADCIEDIDAKAIELDEELEKNS